jgi:hypothetical protein
VPNVWADDPKIGGSAYQGWYHASGVAGNIYSDIFRASSTDRINWTQVTPAPIMTHSGTGYEVEQIADASIQQVGGTSYMFMDADSSGSTVAAIELATINTTLANIVAGL